MSEAYDPEGATFSIRIAKAIVRKAVRKGVDLPVLLANSSVSEDFLDRTEGAISARDLSTLTINTMMALEDEAIGYQNVRVPLGAWAMMCKVAIPSETLGQALNRYCRFFSLFDLSFTLVSYQDEKHGVLDFRVERPEDPPDPIEIEWAMFRSYRFMNWLLREDIPLTRVEFAFPRGGAPAEYIGMFLDAKVEFDAPSSRIVFSGAWLDARLRQTAASLNQYLQDPLFTLISRRYGARSWTSRVHACFRTSITEEHELERISASLAIHPQTLRRRLREEGTSFKEVKDRARRDIALYHLRHGDRVDDVAVHCGFSEVSAFIRAFHRWTGSSPGAYRRQRTPT